MKRSMAKLKGNEENQAYSRNFRKQLRHVGSFLGRGFKQLMQVLPGLIAEEFTDPAVDKDLLLLNEALIALGRLWSLVFVRQVEGCFNQYVEAIKKTVEDLTVKLFNFDITTDNHTPFSTRPKIHYLHHLHEDIHRFGCALHFETEKGEMFNKFIREQLFHTNKHNPSRDVAVRFSKQQVLKHIVDGGSWVNSQGKRVKYGAELEAHIKADETFFRQQFSGAREFAENNYSQITTKLPPGFKGIFKRKSSLTR
ncbi:hypothetical protein CLU79DRAFT_890973 [Phycomyces nitens]|nr:hypothetical protein CLU79DRAFT_890973 [Phycomyces nitens]